MASLSVLLIACGADEAATSVPAAARAAATRVPRTMPPNTVATAVAMATAAADSPRATAGASGPQLTVTGEVTKLDPVARSFTVRGSDGKDYNFAAGANGQVDLTALAANLASRQQITATYRGGIAPYEVVTVR